MNLLLTPEIQKRISASWEPLLPCEALLILRMYEGFSNKVILYGDQDIRPSKEAWLCLWRTMFSDVKGEIVIQIAKNCYRGFHTYI